MMCLYLRHPHTHTQIATRLAVPDDHCRLVPPEVQIHRRRWMLLHLTLQAADIPMHSGTARRRPRSISSRGGRGLVQPRNLGDSSLTADDEPLANLEGGCGCHVRVDILLRAVVPQAAVGHRQGAVVKVVIEATADVAEALPSLHCGWARTLLGVIVACVRVLLVATCGAAQSVSLLETVALRRTLL